MKRIILVYHGIGEIDKFLEVEYGNFIKQIEFLLKRNFSFCNFNDIMLKRKGNNVCIMFDDALKTSLKAIDFLQSKNLKYDIAIIENKISKKNYLSFEDLRKLKNVQFHFHTLDHKDLTSLNNIKLEKEIDSTFEIYKEKTLVYPMGKYNDNVIKSLNNKKIKYGLSVLPFHLSKNSSPFEIPRICINGFYSFSRFKFYVSILGNWYLHVAFIKRKLMKQNYLER